MIYKALIIGVNKYIDSNYSSLDSVIQDVLKITQIVEESPNGFTPTIIKSKNATKGKILDAITSFFENCNNNDVLFLYWVGHGTSTGNFVTYDTEFNNQSSTSIPMCEIGDMINQCRAATLIAVFDCCFSGATVRSENLTAAFNIRGRGKAIMTSSDYTQKSFNDEKSGHGRFTYHFLEGLKGAAAIKNGIITVNSLYDYIAIAMENEKQMYPELQTPIFKSTEIGYVALNQIDNMSANSSVNTMPELNTSSGSRGNLEIISDSGNWCTINDYFLKYDSVNENTQNITITIKNPTRIWN